MKKQESPGFSRGEQVNYAAARISCDPDTNDVTIDGQTLPWYLVNEVNVDDNGPEAGDMRYVVWLGVYCANPPAGLPEHVKVTTRQR